MGGGSRKIGPLKIGSNFMNSSNFIFFGFFKFYKNYKFLLYHATRSIQKIVWIFHKIIKVKKKNSIRV